MSLPFLYAPTGEAPSPAAQSDLKALLSQMQRQQRQIAGLEQRLRELESFDAAAARHSAPQERGEGGLKGFAASLCLSADTGEEQADVSLWGGGAPLSTASIGFGALAKKTDLAPLITADTARSLIAELAVPKAKVRKKLFSGTWNVGESIQVEGLHDYRVFQLKTNYFACGMLGVTSPAASAPTVLCGGGMQTTGAGANDWRVITFRITVATSGDTSTLTLDHCHASGDATPRSIQFLYGVL